MASLFCGLRIDNCHSTPIHVASYFLDAARNLNPNLYVFAELFTGSEEQDIMFVSKLGINSLIREAMQPSDTAELSRLAHRFGGGNPIGSFTISASQYPLEGLGHKVNDVAATRILNATVDVKGCSPHAMFMDCTHDNETPHQKRTGADTLSTAAIVAMSCCAVGSVKGFDELVPNLLNVVSETSKYRLARSSGIVQAKAELSKLHLLMAEQGYSQVHVHQENDFISIHRKHPTKNKGYLLIARTAFRSQNPTRNCMLI